MTLCDALFVKRLIKTTVAGELNVLFRNMVSTKFNLTETQVVCDPNLPALRRGPGFSWGTAHFYALA